jgi:hypothetical protein
MQAWRFSEFSLSLPRHIQLVRLIGGPGMLIVELHFTG